MAMNLNEDATLTLKANTRDISNELGLLDTKAKSIKDTLKEIEKTGAGKGSEEWKKYKTELAAVNVELGKVRKEADLSKLTFGQLNNLVGQLNRDLKSLVPGTQAFVDATKRLNDAKTRLKEVNDQVNSINKESDQLGQPTRWQKITSGVGSVANAFRAFMALQVIGFIIDIGKSIFETTAKFEKYEKVLTTAFGGNVKMAKESMLALRELGAKTAYSVDELTEGYVKLVNRGIRPSKSEMVALTDLAASQGKTFDQLVEGLLDAATAEFERLKEFGTRASKAGDEVSFKFKQATLVIKNTGEGFEVLDKKTGKVVNTFKDQEDATLAVMTTLGKLEGVGGQNAKMMDSLSGKSSNLGDSFDALKVELGTGLRPVFVGILDLIQLSIPLLSLLGKGVGTVILTAKFGVESLVGILKNAGLAVFEFGTAAYELAKGNFDGAKKAWDNAKTYSKSILTSVTDSAKITNKQIDAIWKNPNAGINAELAGKDQGKKYQGGLSDEQKKAIKEREKETEKARKKEEADHKKHLEDVQKANAKALDDLAKLEAETHINSIQDEMQREFAKLGAKRDAEAEEIMKSLASEKLKNQQIAQLDLKLQQDVTRVAGEYAEKKRKKAEEEEKKRLDAEKAIIEQERQAHNALLDWRELMAKGNAKKLADVHRERVTVQYNATVEKLNAEEAAEKAKATREITDKEQLDRALTAIEGRYHNERLLAEKKHADEVDKVNKELQEKKKAAWTAAGNAFSSLLKGDLNAFVDYADKIVQGEKSAWQKRIAENEAKYAAVAQMAQAAVQFLNDLEQRKAERAIAAARKERDEKVALLNDRVAAEKAAEDAAEAEKQRVTQESNDKIQAIKSASEQTISSLEAQYRQLSSREEKAKLDQQLTGYKENAEGKSEAAKQAADEAIEAAEMEAKQSIDAAQKAEKETIKSATAEKNGKIDAAEAAMTAEVAAINKRTDVDSQTRQKMLTEAKDRFDKEKQMAEDEAKLKIDAAKSTAEAQADLAKDTAKLKIDLAKDQETAELKAIEAIQKGDETAAKEILARAKEDAQEKIRLAKDEAEKKIDLAEQEKREKLKKVEAEKQTRIQNQKELNRSIEQENESARKKEAAAKQQAWKAQQKADIASAVITGALATLKALASAIWPVNLVFAALSAVMTGVQVAKIKSQPMPSFERGGFVAKGGRHGSTYGAGGIGLFDRATGRDVGEMEGDEAIISREQTKANWPLIERMFSNARTPGKRNVPVSDDRPPVGFRDGGLFESPYWKREMYLFGSKKAKKAAAEAEASAKAAAAEAEASASSFEGGGSYEGGDGDGIADAQAAGAEAQKQGQEQLKLLGEIRDSVKDSAMDTKSALTTLNTNLTQAIESGTSAQRMALSTLGVNLTTALEQTETVTKTGLSDLKTTLKTSLDGLSRTLVLTLTRSQTNQSSDIDKLIEELRTQTDRLGLGLQLSLQEGTGKTVTAINGAKTANQLVVSNLSLRMTDGFNKLLNQSKNDFDTLAERIENSQADATDTTVRAINNARLTNQRALDNLTLKTVTSLDKLSDETTKALDSLERATVDALDDATTREERALTDLSDALTLALDILNRDSKRSLTTLGDRTERSLTSLADRTTRSVDSLSIEVRSLKGSINAVEGAVRSVEGATRGVEGAVYGTNQAGRLDALIAGISTFGGK